eukprot:TRINITY_DN12955_c0_g1_i1.p1 TRINITY_DN12955_c0_g1~~TRINITY_DN12955_c0_g1_i1.p1  ORF type:complete len:684 (-),score=222.60 TRINITY_DN12955_c0_g1_i1:170-2221(-)
MPSMHRLLVVGLASVATAEEYDAAKVVKLLTEMKSELEAEAKADADVDSKMQTWCKENTAAKEKAIKDGEELIPTIKGMIESNTLDAKRLEIEIKQTGKNLEKSTSSLASATAQHEKAMQETEARQADMREYVTALGKAEVKLSGKKTAFLSQGSQDPDVTEAAKLAESIQEKYQTLFAGVISSHRQRLLLASASKGQVQKGEPSQSMSEVVGIITGMKEKFTKELAEHKTDQEESLETFAGLEEAKKTEIGATEQSLISKRSQKANADEAAASSTQSLNIAKTDLAANEAYLGDINKRCKAHAEEYPTRVKARKEETAAVAQAIEILSTDEAKSLFSKSLIFLQIQSGRGAVVRQAADVLVKASSEIHDLSMVTLAKSLRTSAGTTESFDRVKQALDKLQLEIKDKKKSESEKRDTCRKRTQKNILEVQKYTRDESNEKAAKAAHEVSKSDLEAAVKTETEEIEKLETELKEAGEARDAAKTEFEQTVKDQQGTQKVLKTALQVLEGEYNKDVALTQNSKKDEPEEKAEEEVTQVGAEKPVKPEEFKAMSQNKKSSTVISLLHMIKRDSQNLEKQARVAEKKAQEEYEEFSKDTRVTIVEKKKAIVNKNADKATAEKALLSSEENLASLTDTLATLEDTKKVIGEDCEHLLENFEIRQKAYDQEMAALAQAKAILSRANLGD